jgi:hypothetical protein
MRTKLIAVAALATAAVTLMAVASAGSAPGKQRVAIWANSCNASACQFYLAPLGRGAVKRTDTGTATFCCWTRRFITRDGQKIEINNPRGTLIGKRGTLIVRQQIEWVDLPLGDDSYAISTGTWKVVRGTGDYAGLSGSGRHAGVQLPNGTFRWREDGFLLSPK